MSPSVQILRFEDLDHGENPTGESLLVPTSVPFKIWIPDQRFLVLGNSQDPEKELHVGPVVADGIPVYKRRSGGGAVLLSTGCLCLGLRFKKQRDLSIQDYFALGSNTVSRIAGEVFGVEIHPRGISDLVVGDRKIAGCALYMPRDFVLYLISVLINPNTQDIEKYLAHPSKEPDYRAKRSHGNFLAGLQTLARLPGTALELTAKLETDISCSLSEHLDWPKK